MWNDECTSEKEREQVVPTKKIVKHWTRCFQEQLRYDSDVLPRVFRELHVCFTEMQQEKQLTKANEKTF